MNIKQLSSFLQDETIMPGYRARVGMKFILHTNHFDWINRASPDENGIVTNIDGMTVIARHGDDLIVLHNPRNGHQYKIPLKEVKKTTIVKIEEGP